MPDALLMVSFGFFRLILSFLHIVYSGLEYFDTAWALFKRKVESLVQSNLTDSQAYVSRFVTELEKCPSHFAVIVGTGTSIGCDDFSNLVMWCTAAGISFITFYDYTGYLKSKEKLYYSHLVNKRKLDPSYVVFNVNKKNGTTNGVNKRKIHVNILSLEDGKQLFARLVGSTCERVLARELKSEDIDEGFIDCEMHRMLGFGDPELAIVCGRICATFGFLPWHIKLTEFLQVPSIQNMRVSEFTSILKRYSLCQQRYGR